MGRWTDPPTGRRQTVNAFAMVLCCSRHLFVRPVVKMDQRAWTDCHAAAFEFFNTLRRQCSRSVRSDRPTMPSPRLPVWASTADRACQSHKARLPAPPAMLHPGPRHCQTRQSAGLAERPVGGTWPLTWDDSRASSAARGGMCSVMHAGACGLSAWPDR